MGYIPRKGDVIWLHFNPQTGREQAGHRPCLVLSPELYNSFGLCVVCPITSIIKGYRWEVALSDDCKTKGVILSDQVKNLDWRARRAEFIEVAPEELVEQVLDCVEVLLFSK